jgi:hypothetical protein
MAKVPDYMPGLLVGLFALTIVLNYRKLSWVMLLVSVGVGMLTFALTSSITISTGSAIVAMFVMATVMPKNEGFETHDVTAGPPEIQGLLKKVKDSTYENFNTNTPPSQIANTIRKMKIEGFNTNTPATEIASTIQQMKNSQINEGFMNNVARNIQQNGLSTPGFGMGGPLVEGYEDVKKEKDEKPAPALKVKEKEPMAMPFTLGEIPSQAKNGPHIDAGSTLIKAIQGLNPEQINAMTKDTQQLI